MCVSPFSAQLIFVGYQCPSRVAEWLFIFQLLVNLFTLGIQFFNAVKLEGRATSINTKYIKLFF